MARLYHGLRHICRVVHIVSQLTGNVHDSFNWTVVCLEAQHVGNCEINASPFVRNLGAWLDNRFLMDSHVTKTCGAAFFYLHNIRRIRKYLSRDASEKLVHAFVTISIDYCNSLLYGLPACQLAPIQRVQNAAARLIFKETKSFHITPLLK